MRSAVAVVAVAVIPVLTSSAALAESPAALQPFAFLIGEWRATESAGSGGSSGTAVFTRGLQERLILRTSYAEYPAADGKPPSRHDDLMIIYASPDGRARADYYDNEGHVIRYVVSSPGPGQAVFVSEAAGGGPRYRLTYRLEPTGVLEGEFAIAPPEAPNAFKPYLTWCSRKISGAGK